MNITKTAKFEKHYSSTGYVYDYLSDQFLMIFHKKFQKWMPPGGHIMRNEEPNQAVLREVYEETGLHGFIIQFPNQMKPLKDNVSNLPMPFCLLNETIPSFGKEQEHGHINFIYVILVKRPINIKLSMTEASDFQWISLNTIDELVTFDSVKNIFKSINTALRENGKIVPLGDKIIWR